MYKETKFVVIFGLFVSAGISGSGYESGDHPDPKSKFDVANKKKYRHKKSELKKKNETAGFFEHSEKTGAFYSNIFALSVMGSLETGYEKRPKGHK